MSDSCNPFRHKKIVKGLHVLSTVFVFVIGIVAFVQGISCLYGGPDGLIFSRTALQYGGFFLLIWLVCCGVFLALQRRNRAARRFFLISHEALLLLYWLAMIPATIRSGAPETFALQGLLLAVLATGGCRIVRTGRQAGRDSTAPSAAAAGSPREAPRGTNLSTGTIPVFPESSAPATMNTPPVISTETTKKQEAK